MEFSEYVDARRTTLVRAAVLLGLSIPDAEDVVQATLTRASRSWRRLQRGDDIDGDIYGMLVDAIRDPRHPIVYSALESLESLNLDDSTPEMVSRRRVAEMPHDEREVLVLRYFLDLSEPTTARLLGLWPASLSHADEAAARRLVQEASETIEVAPVAFVPSPQDRRTSWLRLAAVGLGLLVAAAIALSWWSGDDKSDDVTPESDHQIPSVFGYNADSARDLLEAKGWDVANVDSASCEPAGRALATVPQAGATPSSRSVKLLVSVPADGLGCNFDPGSKPQDRALAWQVLDFARTGSALDFSDEVTVVVNGQRQRITADEATMRRSLVMQDLVRVLTDDAGAVLVEGGTWTTPLLTTTIDPGDSLCGGLDLPRGFGDRESLLMYVALPAFNTAPTGKCHFLNVFSTDGVVDGLVLRTGLTTTPKGPTVAVPDVVGLDVEDARAVLRIDDFKVKARESDGCPGTTVLEQIPEAGVLAKYGSTVRLEIGREAANTCL